MACLRWKKVSRVETTYIVLHAGNVSDHEVFRAEPESGAGGRESASRCWTARTTVSLPQRALRTRCSSFVAISRGLCLHHARLLSLYRFHDQPSLNRFSFLSLFSFYPLNMSSWSSAYPPPPPRGRSRSRSPYRGGGYPPRSSYPEGSYPQDPYRADWEA